MSSFKIWLEFQSQKEDKLRKLWQQTFVDLGISGPAKADTANMSLEDATRGDNRKDPAGVIIINKLKTIFDELKKIPEFAANVDNAIKWLGTSQSSGETTAPKRSVGELLKLLYGEHFGRLMSNDAKASDDPDAEPMKAPPQPPTPTATPQVPPTPPDQPNQPEEPMPGQQPQMPPQPPMPGMPNNPVPMPPQPKGFGMGLY